MLISTSVTLGEGESLDLTPDKAAAKVLKALGGDPKKDTSEFHLLVAPVTGGVGVMPATQTPDFTPLEPTTNDDAVANDDAPEA